MYRKIVSIIFLTVSVVCTAEYTLEDLVTEAIRNSRQVQGVQKEIEKTRYQVKEAIGSGLPKISGSAYYSYGEPFSPFTSGGSDTSGFGQALANAYSFDTSLSRIGPIITGITLGQLSGMFDDFTKKNTLSLNLSVEQPIFAQGKVGIGLKIAKSYQTSLQYKLKGEELNVKGLVTKLFYGALLAKVNVSIQKEAVKLAEETHRLAVIQHAVGKGSELDTLISRLRLENARIDIKKSESDLRLAYEAILTQTCIQDAASSFSIKGDFPDVEFALNEDEAVGEVMVKNADIQFLESSQAMQDQLVELAKSDFYPMVYAGGSFGKISQFNNFDELKDVGLGNDWKVFAGLSMDLFTGFRRSQKLNQARTDNQKFVLTKEEAKDGLVLATKNAYEQVTLSKDRLKATRSVLVLAEKGYSIAKKAYEVGSKTFLDVQNAEFELNRAKIALSAAKFAFHTALIDLKLLMGNL
ncbi:MAG: TolC family protein [Chitinispirillaceae bacterium]|nr:TolC family protein [Chitinispirillaceae bacterium]